MVPKRYRNAFVFIREKNDYSPIEKEGLAYLKKLCVDAEIPRYQIFDWKGIDIATFVCYEFTDIFARALLKGNCDVIAMPVYNDVAEMIDFKRTDKHEQLNAPLEKTQKLKKVTVGLINALPLLHMRLSGCKRPENGTEYK